MRKVLLILSLLLCVGRAQAGQDRHATGVTLGEVQAAVNLANNGDRVLIPNGSSTWNAPLDILGKRIIIQAENITSATTLGTGGTMPARNVVITNGSATTLMTFTTGNDFHCGLGGIRINEGSGAGNYLTVNGSGSKPMLIFDCYFEVQNRFGNPPNASIIRYVAQGGVMWNTWIQGVGGGSGGQCCPEGASVQVFSPRPWASASTMGTLDVGGLVNFYVEDCHWQDFGQSPDIDDNGRVVMRHNWLDGTSGLTHGFTSPSGGRHAEYYNNTIRCTSNLRNIASRGFWLRAGTMLWTDNDINLPNQGFGDPHLADVGDTVAPGTGNASGSYPINRAPGQGHNGTNFVSDPIYVWNNTGPDASNVNVVNGWDSNVVAGRDIFINQGPKPGVPGSGNVAYAKFTWPHPLRSVITGGSPDTTPPTVTSATINTAGTQLTLNFDENVIANTANGLTIAVSPPGLPVTVTGIVSGNGTPSVVFSLSRVIGVGQALTRTYVQPGNGIEDMSAGNDMANFTTQGVVNNSTQDITPPTPSPMTFLIAPFADTLTSVSMTATTASDATAVEYLFDETSGNAGGTDSAWQPGTNYIDTGLTTGTTYTYRVKARDVAGNETILSTPASATPVANRGAYPISPANSTRSGIVSP